MRNLQEQVLTFHCLNKLCANSRPLASNFKSLSRSLEQFSLTVGQNSFWLVAPDIVLWFKKPYYTVHAEYVSTDREWNFKGTKRITWWLYLTVSELLFYLGILEIFTKIDSPKTYECTNCPIFLGHYIQTWRLEGAIVEFRGFKASLLYT